MVKKQALYPLIFLLVFQAIQEKFWALLYDLLLQSVLSASDQVMFCFQPWSLRRQYRKHIGINEIFLSTSDDETPETLLNSNEFYHCDLPKPNPYLQEIFPFTLELFLVV